MKAYFFPTRTPKEREVILDFLERNSSIRWAGGGIRPTRIQEMPARADRENLLSDKYLVLIAKTAPNGTFTLGQGLSYSRKDVNAVRKESLYKNYERTVLEIPEAVRNIINNNYKS